MTLPPRGGWATALQGAPQSVRPEHGRWHWFHGAAARAAPWTSWRLGRKDQTSSVRLTGTLRSIKSPQVPGTKPAVTGATPRHRRPPRCPPEAQEHKAHEGKRSFTIWCLAPPGLTQQPQQPQARRRRLQDFRESSPLSPAIDFSSHPHIAPANYRIPSIIPSLAPELHEVQPVGLGSALTQTTLS